MSRVRRPCGRPTMTGGHCRRTAAWTLKRGSAVSCWQHAVGDAQDAGAPELMHWITGARRPVPQRIPVVDDSTAPLPQGVDAIVRFLNTVRSRRALARGRMAICQDIEHCHDQRSGLRQPVGEALARAKSRLGITPSTFSPNPGVRRR